jgi:uncharacterized membrane protein YhaH (DUF805 family)
MIKLLFDMVSYNVAVRNAFKKAFDFSSRATRAEYWWWFLCNFMVTMSFSILNVMFGGYDKILLVIPCGIWGLIAFIIGLSLLVRRLHDIGKSAWCLLWYLLPYVGAIVIFVMTLLPSAPDNKYGPAIS